MSPKNQINCWINVETGALVFAICNIIITSLAALTSLGFLCFSIQELYAGSTYDRDTYLMIISATLMVVVFSVIAFVFSIILFKGVVKKRPGYLKVYLVYGVLVIVLSLATSVCLAFFFRNNYANFVIFMSTIAAIVIALFFYTLALLTIRATYKKFELEMNPPRYSVHNYFVNNILMGKY